jgi:hypothetical protein
VGVPSFAPQVELERLDEGCGVAGGDRVNEVELVEGVPVAVEVGLEAGPCVQEYSLYPQGASLPAGGAPKV